MAFAILPLEAGEDDFVLLFVEVEVKAGACEAAGGGAGADGCGLLATGLGLFPALGARVDFAFAATSGAAGGDETGDGAVSETVCTAATGAGAGLAATATAGAGGGIGAGGGVETLVALTGAEATGRAIGRSATRFAIEAFGCESFGST